MARVPLRERTDYEGLTMRLAKVEQENDAFRAQIARLLEIINNQGIIKDSSILMPACAKEKRKSS